MAAKDRRERFAREYVIDLNGTRSAIAAGYSERGADVAAVRLLRNASVRKQIDRLKSARASRLEIKADRMLEKLDRLTDSNMLDYMEVAEDGKPVGLNLSNLTREQAYCIQEISEDHTGGTGDGERKVILRTKFKLVDKVKPLDMLMRHLGLYNDKLAITGLEGLASNLSELRKLKNAGAGS